jgi:hypothetical protein
MQRICPVPGGIKSYLEAPGALLTEEMRQCPICTPAHRLRRHGWYERWGIFPDPEPSCRIPVLRLLCVMTSRTISLLPDFCLPFRQHGPDILGPFLWGVAISGLSLSAALGRLRRGSRHSVASHLWRGFGKRATELAAYVAGRRARAPTVPESVDPARRAVAQQVLSLVADGTDVAAAFRRHGRLFHRRFGLGLA